jgi:SPP1 gp7 family putative phage head morphogenesis protein
MADDVTLLTELQVLSFLLGMEQINLEAANLSGLPVTPPNIPSDYQNIVQNFIERSVLTRQQFDQLEEAYRRRAFTVSYVDKKNLIAAIQKEVAAEMLTGGDESSFRNRLDGFWRREGMDPLSDHHVQVVYRNNHHSAYNDGRLQAAKQLAPEEFPGLAFDATMDGRTRPSHRQLHGYTAPVNDAIWNVLRPPLDHNCRCTVSLVHKDDFAGYTPALPIDLSTAPDMRFINKKGQT